MGFARFLISHIHLRFYRIYMLFTRSLIACASGSAAARGPGITKGAGSVATVSRRLFGGSYLHRVGLKSEHEKLDTYVAYRLDGDS